MRSEILETVLEIGVLYFSMYSVFASHVAHAEWPVSMKNIKPLKFLT